MKRAPQLGLRPTMIRRGSNTRGRELTAAELEELRTRLARAIDRRQPPPATEATCESIDMPT